MPPAPPVITATCPCSRMHHAAPSHLCTHRRMNRGKQAGSVPRTGLRTVGRRSTTTRRSLHSSPPAPRAARAREPKVRYRVRRGRDFRPALFTGGAMESSLNLGTTTSGHRRWVQKCPPRGLLIVLTSGSARGLLSAVQSSSRGTHCDRSLCSTGRREALATLTRSLRELRVQQASETSSRSWTTCFSSCSSSALPV